MDQVFRWITEIPPVTRYWSLSIIITSLLTSIGICSLSQFMFSIERAFWRQPWILLTSFCYYDSLSTELVLNVFFLMRLSRYLEESYQTKRSLFPTKKVRLFTPRQWREVARYTDAYKTYDYLYYLFLICSSIVAVVSLGWYKRYFVVWKLGPILNDVILYIWCKNNPEVEVNLMGFLRVTSAYLPWVYTVLNVLLLGDFQRDVFDLYSGRDGHRVEKLVTFFQKVVTQSYFWKVIIRYGTGHLWWYLGDFSPQLFYYDQNDERRMAQSIEGGKRQQQKFILEGERFNVVQSISGLIMLPPWYRLVVAKISKMRFLEDEEGVDEGQADGGQVLGGQVLGGQADEEEEGAERIQDVEVDIEIEDI